MRGNDKGKRGKVTRVLDERDAVVVEGVNLVKRHLQARRRSAAAASSRSRRRSRSRKVMPVDPTTGKPTRVSLQDRRATRRFASPRAARRSSEAKKMSDGQQSTSRACATRYEKEIVPGADEALRLQEPDAGAAPPEDRGQHGPRRGRARTRSSSTPPSTELTRHHRSEAGRHARQEGDRDLQAARGHADRRDGHAAPRAHVGVPRPPGHARPAARARLPRRQPARPSTAPATTRSACASRSSSPRSTSTRSRRSRA